MPNTSTTHPTRVFAPVATKDKKKPSSALFDTIVTVLVGPKHVKYGIHKALLCHHSSFFKAALTGNFMEAEHGTINMEDEDEETFSRFHAWLYTRDFWRDEDEKIQLLRPALDICLFAEKRFVLSLHNAIIDLIIRECCKDSRYELSAENAGICVSAWERCGDSRLRTFLVDFLVVYFDLEVAGQEAVVASFPVELITQMAIRAQRDRKDADLFNMHDMRECHCWRYHLHDVGVSECDDLVVSDVDDTEDDDDGGLEDLHDDETDVE